MVFALEYKRDNRGSLKACGVGFDYHYDKNSNKLTITQTGDTEQLFLIELPKSAAAHAAEWIDCFEKSSQLKALMYSGNKTTNLTHILDAQRLRSILKTSKRHADYCLLLRDDKHQDFSIQFCQEHDLYSFIIHAHERGLNAQSYLFGEITTQYGNSVHVRSNNIPTLLLYLSERIVGDLITAEYGYNSKSYSQNLLLASSTLATISRILNQDFTPEEHVIQQANANTLIDSQI